MAEYYYFAATLPMLTIGRPVPISYAEFMERAKEHLTKKDYQDLEKAVFSAVSGEASNSLVREWQAYTSQISRVMAKERADKLGFTGYEGDSEADKLLRDKVKDIVDNKDPLEGEKALLAMYFDFLSSREGGSPFSSKALMIYALKLQIMERDQAFTEEKGRAEFDSLYKAIETDIFR